MGKISSDLKHVLNNLYTGESDISLENPISFSFDPKMNTGIKEIDSEVKHEIRNVYKKGNSWKMADEFDNEWTISNLEGIWQSALYYNLLSMKDKRHNPVEYKLSL